MKNKKTILWGVIAVLVVGVVYLFRKKDDDQTALEAVENTPPSKATPPLVLIVEPGTNVYAENSGKIGKTTRYTKTPNEKAGKFLGYQTINQSVYVVFNDIYNKGIKSLVLKALTNYKNK